MEWHASGTHYNIPLDLIIRDAIEELLQGKSAFVASRGGSSLARPEMLLPDKSWSIVYSSETGSNIWTLSRSGMVPELLGISLDKDSASVHVHVFSPRSYAEANKILDQVTGALPAPPAPQDGRVAIHFWAATNNGPTRRRRTLDAGHWADISRNYSHNSAEKLAVLMPWAKPPTDGGRLVLFHGPPGTGKTHAIRALALEWKAWCEVHYVVDPEKFFGSADYMLSVLLDDPDNYITDGDGELKQWRLVVIEDADELLRIDAKERTGQSMSRLLNVCDGLVGQGLNVLILITTNEKLEQLHPAVTRPGRCLADIHVGALSAHESTAWLGRPVTGEHPVAELYEMVRGPQIKAAQEHAGHGQYL